MTTKKTKGATHPKNGTKKNGLKQEDMTEQEKEITGLEQEKATTEKNIKQENEVIERIGNQMVADSLNQQLEEEKREELTQEINQLCEEISENTDQMFSIESESLNAFYNRLYIKLKEQKKVISDKKRKEYNHIRKNRETVINEYKKNGSVDVSEFIKERDETIKSMGEAIKNGDVNVIASHNIALFEITQKINYAEENVDKYFLELYKRNVKKSQKDYYNARDVYKDIRENRKKVISEFESNDISYSDVEEARMQNLLDIQRAMNVLFPIIEPE